MKRELIESIALYMNRKYKIDIEEAALELEILLKDYEIKKMETALAIRGEGINEEYLKRFLTAKAVSGRTKRTLEFYKKEVEKALLKMGKPIDEITADDIRLWLAVRQAKDKVSKVTADNELRAFKSFCAWLTAEELIKKNPCLKIDKIKQDKIQKSAFTEIEIEKIRNACKNTRETAMIEVLLSTGCRASEMANMKTVDLQKDRLIVFGKGNKERIVYLNAKATIALENYLAERKDKNPYIFPRIINASIFEKGKKNKKQRRLYCKGESFKDPELVDESEPIKRDGINGKIKQIAKRAGVEKAHTHKFRRTCATLALRRGMPIEQVAKMLGHNDLTTTQVYLDMTAEELQLAHRKYVV